VRGGARRARGHAGPGRARVGPARRWSIGAAYSCPPLRLKRFPALAALSITCVRTLIVNLGVWLHFAATFGGGTSLAGVPAACGR
jgi:hypothetical protein